jgi:HEAT repeat protein
MSAKPTTRSNRRMVLIILAMVIVWVVVVMQRSAIRARWWEYKLLRVESLEDRARYLALLCSLGQRAVPSARRLLQSDAAPVRSYALVILDQVPGEAATRLLRTAVDDPDPDIRLSAVRGLAFRDDLIALAEIVRSDDEVAACAAAEGLASLASDQAVNLLITQVREHPLLAVRVQAIQCLGHLGAVQAVDVLTECLNDDTLFDGATLTERTAAAAIQTVGPSQPLELPGPRTVADFAAAALERITGQRRPTSAPSGE